MGQSFVCAAGASLISIYESRRLDRYQPQSRFERAHILMAQGRDEDALKVEWQICPTIFRRSRK